MLGPRFFAAVAGVFVVLIWSVEGKTLTQCDAVKELQKGGVSETFISDWVCLMQSESGLNTNFVRGPGTASSYSYGVLQINSRKYCKRGRPGGVCNKRCEDFTNDDISDDIACAQKIYNAEGFKFWDGWVKKCKNKPLPDVGDCK